jgi:hypothetical protein
VTRVRKSEYRHCSFRCIAHLLLEKRHCAQMLKVKWGPALFLRARKGSLFFQMILLTKNALSTPHMLPCFSLRSLTKRQRLQVKLLPAILRINPDAERGGIPLQPGSLEKLARSTHFDHRDHLVPRVLFALPLVSLPSLTLLLFGVCSGWGSGYFS